MINKNCETREATVKGAPNVDEDGHLSPQEEEQLYRYYGVQYTGGVETGRGAGGGGTRGGGDTGRPMDRDGDVDRDVEGRGVGRDTSGPNTDSAMTRSEER